MAEVRRSDVEILVHTSAPSRGSDDAQYRALAQAYLNFQPLSRRRLGCISSPGLADDADVQAESQLQAELLHDAPEERESAASYRPDNEEAVNSLSASIPYGHHPGVLQPLESPALSFNSAFENDSPVFREFILRREQVTENAAQEDKVQNSWQTPPSITTIEDSQPEISRTLTFASPTTVLGTCLRKLQGSGDRSLVKAGENTLSDEPGSNGTRVITTSSNTADIAQPSPSPAQGPRRSQRNKTQAGLLAPTQESGFKAKRKLPGSSSQVCETPSSAPTRFSEPLLPLNRSPTRLQKKQCIRPVVTGTTDSQAVCSTQPEIIPSSTPANSSKINELPSPGVVSTATFADWSQMIEIRSKPPPTSSSFLTPEIVVTQALHDLALKMPLKILFRPVSQARVLRPMERGYWRVNVSNFSSSVRTKCWKFLGEFVGKGQAGWGVWCVRDGEEEFTSIRVYCWGVTVRHVFLLLYLASSSKLKETGACWIGGNGEVVIRMSGAVSV